MRQLKQRLLRLSLLFHGVQASVLGDVFRFILVLLGYSFIEVIPSVTDCVLHERVKTCKFPTLNFGKDNTITFRVRDDELLLMTSSSTNNPLGLIPTTSTTTLRTRNEQEKAKAPYTTIRCTRVETHVEGVFHYECEGSDANFIQVVDEKGRERTYGTLHIEDNVCRIQPMISDDDDDMIIICTPISVFDDEQEVDDEIDEEYEEAASRRIEEKFSHVRFGMDESALQRVGDRRLFDDSGETIDLLVVWTKKAECLNAGLSESCVPTQATASRMKALVMLAVQETNIAFSLSGVETTLRLVHAYRHELYEEPVTNVYLTIIRDAKNVDDGKMEDIHEKRKLYGADVVHVIAGGKGSCGIGHVGPGIARMFSVSRFSCAVGHYSFGHEIAHNLGAHHDRGTLQKCDSTDRYNYGYKDPSAEFRSIMAYGCQVGHCDNMPKNGCPRVQRFSNTQFDYQGKNIGDDANNNARAINENLKTVAAYYPAMHCETNSDCNDHDSATIDTCERQGVCLFRPIGAPTSAPTVAPTLQDTGPMTLIEILASLL